LTEQIGVADDRKVNEECSLGELVRQPRGGLQRQARLAAPADPGQRHQLASRE
jgi:hypothetical protein